MTEKVHICASVHIYIYTCVLVDVCKCVQGCACVYGGQWLMSGIIFNHSPPHILRRGSLT